jgi:hypothetical protein
MKIFLTIIFFVVSSAYAQKQDSPNLESSQFSKGSSEQQVSLLRSSEGTPKEGDVYSGMLRLNGKQKIVLPQGEWVVNQVYSTKGGSDWHAPWTVVVMTNRLEGVFRLMTARYFMQSTPRWGQNNCENKRSLTSFSQTIAGSVGSKASCSEFYNIPSPAYTITMEWPNKYREHWGKAISKLSPEFVSALPKNMLLAETEISRSGGLFIRTELLMDISRFGGDSASVQQDVQQSRKSALTSYVLDWRDRFVAALDKGFFSNEEPAKDDLAFSPAASDTQVKLAAASTDSKTKEKISQVTEKNIDTPVAKSVEKFSDKTVLNPIVKTEEPIRTESSKQSIPTKKTELIASISQPDEEGIVQLKIDVNNQLSALSINGEDMPVTNSLSYRLNRTARIGSESIYNVVAVDQRGQSLTKTLSVKREAPSNKVKVVELNPAKITQAKYRDAVAIIIGVEKYKRLPKANYADVDAQTFYDYAKRALGVSPDKIRLLVNENAERTEIRRTLDAWLPSVVKQNSTEVFIFYSGHGLPSKSGDSLFLLPWDADKDYLEDTAILQSKFYDALIATKPKSVTVFLDSCYSGINKNGEAIIANARPLSLKAKAEAVPPNFSVFSASAADEISQSSSELKHGLFSYYLMLGLEGEADSNRDGELSVTEMFDYLKQSVEINSQLIGRKQSPTLAGESSRMLIRSKP